MVAEVGIVVRTKERWGYLRRCLESILAQSFSTYEVALLDSAKNEKTRKIITEFPEEFRAKLKYINTSSISSLGKLINIGIEALATKYIVVLDDDDTWEPEFLSVCVSALQNRFEQKTKGVATHTIIVEEDEELAELKRYVLNPDLTSLSIGRLCMVNQFSPNSFVFERSAWEKSGKHNEDLPVLEDWEFYLRFIRKYNIQIVTEALANYHQRPKINKNSPSNTLYRSKNLHEHFTAVIMNNMMREELDAGKIGLGTVMNISQNIRKNIDYARRTEKKLYKISDKVGKIDSRTFKIKKKLKIK